MYEIDEMIDGQSEFFINEGDVLTKLKPPRLEHEFSKKIAYELLMLNTKMDLNATEHQYVLAVCDRGITHKEVTTIKKNLEDFLYWCGFDVEILVERDSKAVHCAGYPPINCDIAAFDIKLELCEDPNGELDL